MGIGSREHLERTARAWVALWTAPLNVERFLAMHADDFVDHSPAGRQNHRAAYLEGIKAFFVDFPNAVTFTEDCVIDEAKQTVAVRWRLQNDRRSVTGIEIIRIRDAQIAERWGEWSA